VNDQPCPGCAGSGRVKVASSGGVQPDAVRVTLCWMCGGSGVAPPCEHGYPDGVDCSECDPNLPTSSDIAVMLLVLIAAVVVAIAAVAFVVVRQLP
jgi:hypothetical protein